MVITIPPRTIDDVVESGRLYINTILLMIEAQPLMTAITVNTNPIILVMRDIFFLVLPATLPSVS